MPIVPNPDDKAIDAYPPAKRRKPGPLLRQLADALLTAQATIRRLERHAPPDTCMGTHQMIDKAVAQVYPSNES